MDLFRTTLAYTCVLISSFIRKKDKKKTCLLAINISSLQMKKVKCNNIKEYNKKIKKDKKHIDNNKKKVHQVNPSVF